MKQAKKICIFGSANADYFLYVKSIPAKGETLLAQRYMTANGGKGANQAVAVAKLAGTSNFIGQVGNDDAMRRLKQEMEQANVQLNWKILSNQPTGMAYIYVDKQGENSIVIYGGANMNYQSTTELDPTFKTIIQECDYILLQKEIPMSLVEAASCYAHGLGKQVILDCGGQDQPISEATLSHITYISPNQTELLRIDPTIQLGQDFNFETIVKEVRVKLLVKHPQLNVLLKLGSRGSALVSSTLAVQGESITHTNPEVLDKFKIIDTVGAGDCFTGAFVVRHSELDWSDKEKWAYNYKQAMRFGNSSAFLCITRLGAMPSMPLRKEVDQLMETYPAK